MVKEKKPIFTGDAKRDKTDPPRETGVIGSLRWWYEALIRSLDGTACDPSSSKCDKEKHCVACELFGCTGWSRKFSLIIEKKQESQLIFRFIELRPMEKAEWILLNNTLKIIAGYGIIAGKMTDINKYGLIEIRKNEMFDFKFNRNIVNKYIKQKIMKSEEIYYNSFPNLNNFIFIEGTTLKAKDAIGDIKNECNFLKGEKSEKDKPGKSKRYFYKKDNNEIKRFFAYAEDKKEFNKIKGYFEKRGINFLNNEEVLKELSK